MARYINTPKTSLKGINAELVKVQDAFKDVLDRRGDGANFLDTDLDMNSQRILNLPEPVYSQEPVRLGDVKPFIDETKAARDAAVEAAVSAGQSASSAEQSAASAANSAAKAKDLTEVTRALLTSQGISGEYGFFEEGFTYNESGDVGIDAEGNIWTYNGTMPFTVAAGTTPTSPTYTQVIYGAASQVSTNTSDTVQSFIDKFALKIFQSPTDGGLTKIQTRTVNANEVYEVRKTSDDSLATIYSDDAGMAEIVQNGTSNVSDTAGVVGFYIADGDYYTDVNSVKSYFKSRSISNNYISHKELIDNSTGYAENGLKVSTGASVWLVNSKIGCAISNTSPQLYAKSLNGVFLSDFAGASDGTSDKQQLMQKAFDLSEGGALIVDSGVFYIESDNVDVRSNTKVKGLGGTIKLGGHSAVLRVWDVENVVIDGLNIDGNLLAWTNFGQYTLPIVGSENITVQNCHIYNGQNAGIGIGQQLAPDYNKNIKVLYNHIHNIGMYNHPNFTSYGNGVAVTGGEDIIIQGNTIHDIHQVGFINCEGTLLKNIKILDNICYNSTGRAAGIKCYAAGVDVPAENILVKNNTLYNIGKIGDPDAANTEPTIWIQRGDGVRVVDNDVFECPAVGKAGVISVASDRISTVRGNTIRDCDGGRMEVFSTRDIKVLDNTIECTATSTLTAGQSPLYVESFSTEEGTCRVSGNTVREAPYESIIFNPRSKGILTENMIVNPNRVGGNYGIQETFAGGGFSYSIIGNNVIIDDGNSVLGVAFYNFSSGDTVDMIYKADSWMVDVAFVKYDVGASLRFIQTDVALVAASNPIPTIGYNERGRVIHTANPQAGNPSYYVCVASGTPGTWLPGPVL